MKLRLRGNSLRLRLTKAEVTALRDQGWWQEVTTFAATDGPRFAYRIEVTEAKKAEVRFVTGTETMAAVVLPATDVLSWANSSQVGLYFEEPCGLKVAIEKDFRCLDPRRNEDESDNFDNPNPGVSQHTACDTD